MEESGDFVSKSDLALVEGSRTNTTELEFLGMFLIFDFEEHRL